MFDAALDRDLFRRQQHGGPPLRALDNRLECGEEAEEIDFELGLDVFARDLRDPLVRPQPLRGAHLLPLVQQSRSRFVLLVLEQPPYERITRIFLVPLDAGGGLRPRQQHPRLDVDERGGHHKELACDVQVQLLHQMERIQVLLCDERDGNVVDVHLVLPDEVKQQIERAVEVLEPDGEGVGC